MTILDIYVLAIEVRKWDFDAKKINFTAFTVSDNREFRLLFTVAISTPADMVEELLGKIKKINKDKLNKFREASTFEVQYVNEHFLRQKAFNYFKKVIAELLNPKKKKKQRTIHSVRLDIFSEGQDISFLSDDIRFYVFLNWARKYYERDQFSNVIDPLRKALEIRPDFGTGYKWMARSLNKLRKNEEARRYFEKFAEVEKSKEAYLELALSYLKGGELEKSEKLLISILEEDSSCFEARMGLAQIYYIKQKPFKSILKELYADKPEQVRSYLRDQWIYRFRAEKKIHMNPMVTADYLGIDSVFDLSHRAFKNEIPAHFNPAKARLSFYKEELDNWAELLNTYECYSDPIQLHPEKIKNNKLKKVKVITDELGNDIPDKGELMPSIKVETVQEKKEKPKKPQKVEDVVAKINKHAVIKIENEKKIFNEIKNGNRRRNSGNSGRGKRKLSPTNNSRKNSGKDAPKNTQGKRGRKEKDGQDPNQKKSKK